MSGLMTALRSHLVHRHIAGGLYGMLRVGQLMNELAYVLTPLSTERD